MPPRRDPADPTKRNPTGVRPARAGKRWTLVGTVGNFEPDRVPAKPDTVVLTKQEKAAGATKLDRTATFDYVKGTLDVKADVPADSGPVKPGGGKKVERP